MNKPREWWVDLHDPQMNSKPAECFIQSGRFIHVIEKSAYDQMAKWLDEKTQELGVVEDREYKPMVERDALKAKHEELLSYLPKVPTQSYEKDMAKKILALEAERDVYVHEAEHFQHKAIDLDQANGILKAELNKKEFELAESAIALNAANSRIAMIVDSKNEYKNEAASLRLLVENYRASLHKILAAGNMATQGNWDATNEMKNIAYAALQGDEK